MTVPTAYVKKKKNNFELNLSYWGGEIPIQTHGVITTDGEKIFFWGAWNDIECHTWQSESDLKMLAEDRDSILEPACNYKIQPENQGKLVWLTGTPGAGKSTVGHLMSKESDYVFYEGDSSDAFLNPFIPSNVSGNPTKQAFRQKPLKVTTYLCN